MAASHVWASESGNPYGVRELLLKGKSKPSFIRTGRMELLEENDEDISEQDLDLLDHDENCYAMGYLASNYKNSIDDDGEVKTFQIPRTVTDPGFKINLTTIDPPDGSTHDLNMDPSDGLNKTKDRRHTNRQTADYIYDKCMNIIPKRLRILSGLEKYMLAI